MRIDEFIVISFMWGERKQTRICETEFTPGDFALLAAEARYRHRCRILKQFLDTPFSPFNFALYKDVGRLLTFRAP